MPDWWTLSGWLVGVVSLGLAMIAWIRQLFGDKDRDLLKSHLRSIAMSLDSLRANIAESHGMDDVVKSEVGKRWLSSLAHHTVSIRNEALEALGITQWPAVSIQQQPTPSDPSQSATQP